MDPVSDLLNLSQLAASTNTKKDKKQRGFYRKVNIAHSNNAKSSLMVGETNWTEEDRRTGSDRRTGENDRHKKFEYRYKQDRRKDKTLFIKA